MMKRGGRGSRAVEERRPNACARRSRTKGLEIELDAELEQAAVEDAQRNLPGGVVVVLRRHRIAVGGVVDVEVHRRFRRSDPDRLGESQIQLVQTFAVL